MSVTTENGLSAIANCHQPVGIADSLCITPWETLCDWLTRDLRNMEATIERCSKAGEWVVECVSYPLESVTTHETPNGVRVISIAVRIDGRTKLFEVFGPNSLGVRRNAAGWPVRIELGYEEGQLVLIFSGQMDPPRRSSSNSWGE
jgi:hypothetical protein